MVDNKIRENALVKEIEKLNNEKGAKKLKLLVKIFSYGLIYRFVSKHYIKNYSVLDLRYIISKKLVRKQTGLIWSDNAKKWKRMIYFIPNEKYSIKGKYLSLEEIFAFCINTYDFFSNLAKEVYNEMFVEKNDEIAFLMRARLRYNVLIDRSNNLLDLDYSWFASITESKKDRDKPYALLRKQLDSIFSADKDNHKLGLYWYEYGFLSFKNWKPRNGISVLDRKINDSGSDIEKKVAAKIGYISCTHGSVDEKYKEKSQMKFQKYTSELKSSENDFHRLYGEHWYLHIKQEKGVFNTLENIKKLIDSLEERELQSKNKHLHRDTIDRSYKDFVRGEQLLGIRRDDLLSDKILNEKMDMRDKIKFCDIGYSQYNYLSNYIINNNSNGFKIQNPGEKIEKLKIDVIEKYEQLLKNADIDKRNTKINYLDFKLFCVAIDDDKINHDAVMRNARYLDFKNEIESFINNGTENDISLYEAYGKTLHAKLIAIMHSEFKDNFKNNIIEKKKSKKTPIEEIKENLKDVKKINEKYGNAFGVFRCNFLEHLYTAYLFCRNPNSDGDEILYNSALINLRQLITDDNEKNYPKEIKIIKYLTCDKNELTNGTPTFNQIKKIVGGYMLVMQ